MSENEQNMLNISVYVFHLLSPIYMCVLKFRFSTVLRFLSNNKVNRRKTIKGSFTCLIRQCVFKLSNLILALIVTMFTVQATAHHPEAGSLNKRLMLSSSFRCDQIYKYEIYNFGHTLLCCLSRT